MNAVEVHCSDCGARFFVDRETYERDIDRACPYLCKKCSRDKRDGDG